MDLKLTIVSLSLNQRLEGITLKKGSLKPKIMQRYGQSSGRTFQEKKYIEGSQEKKIFKRLYYIPPKEKKKRTDIEM